MNKKLIGILVAVVLICAILVAFLVVTQNSENKNQKDKNNKPITDGMNQNEKNEDDTNQNTSTQDSKVLVVYFSAQNHTREVAKRVAENLDADIFEIVPEEKYSEEDLDWTDNKSRVSKEHDNQSLRSVKLIDSNVENWDQYDTILIGYPIWWGIAAWPVDTFVKANDFGGKKVIPFCTSASSGIGQSGQLLAESANGGDWLEGYRFSSNATDNDIKSWTDRLK
ncbi:MAG: flavodoxin [Bacilli bacterium]|nr:flavodoxin [Bacilli bacterium]